MTLLMALVIFPSMLFSADKVRFANHVKTNALYTLPILAAMEKGFFKQPGLKLRYLPLRSGPARIAVLKSGVVQATVGTFLGTMVPCSQGRGVAVG